MDELVCCHCVCVCACCLFFFFEGGEGEGEGFRRLGSLTCHEARETLTESGACIRPLGSLLSAIPNPQPQKSFEFGVYGLYRVQGLRVLRFLVTGRQRLGRGGGVVWIGLKYRVRV